MADTKRPTLAISAVSADDPTIAGTTGVGIVIEFPPATPTAKAHVFARGIHGCRLTRADAEARGRELAHAITMRRPYQERTDGPLYDRATALAWMACMTPLCDEADQ